MISLFTELLFDTELIFFEKQEDKKVRIRQENKSLLIPDFHIFLFLNRHKFTNFYPAFIW